MGFGAGEELDVVEAPGPRFTREVTLEYIRVGLEQVLETAAPVGGDVFAEGREDGRGPSGRPARRTQGKRP